MKRFVISAFILSIVYSLPVYTQHKGEPAFEGGSYALLIGLNDYNHSEIKSLQHPVNEIDSMAEILEMSGYQVFKLYDSLATRGHILSALDTLVNNRDTADRILCYYSGYGTNKDGIQMLRGNGEVLNDFSKKGEQLMFPLFQKGSETFNSFIEASELVDKLNKSRAYQKVLMVDASYYGAPFPPLTYQPVLYNDGLKEGFNSIVSIKSHLKDGEHSPIIFAGLNGAADKKPLGNSDGQVSTHELSVLLNKALQLKYRHEHGTLFKVWKISLGSGEFQINQYAP